MRLFIVFLSMCSVIFLSAPVSAHTVSVDEARNVGMVVHVSPDDNPVVGEVATINLDFQLPGIESITAKMVHGATEQTIEFDYYEALAHAEYTFADQGTYTLKVAVLSEGETYNFEHTIEISPARGSSDSRHMFIVLSIALFAVGIVVLMVFTRNRRKL